MLSGKGSTRSGWGKEAKKFATLETPGEKDMGRGKQHTDKRWEERGVGMSIGAYVCMQDIICSNLVRPRGVAGHGGETN